MRPAPAHGEVVPLVWRRRQPHLPQVSGTPSSGQERSHDLRLYAGPLSLLVPPLSAHAHCALSCAAPAAAFVVLAVAFLGSSFAGADDDGAGPADTDSERLPPKGMPARCNTGHTSAAFDQHKARPRPSWAQNNTKHCQIRLFVSPPLPSHTFTEKLSAYWA